MGTADRGKAFGGTLDVPCGRTGLSMEKSSFTSSKQHVHIDVLQWPTHLVRYVE